MSTLEKYAKELKIKEISLEQLIESHRYLRNENKKTHQERLEEVQKITKLAYEHAKETAFKYNYFSKKALQSMSVLELANLLYEKE